MLETSEEKEKSQQQHKAEMAFRLMDRNNDGFITKQEMLNTTKKLTQAQVRDGRETKHEIILISRLRQSLQEMTKTGTESFLRKNSKI